MKRLIALLFGFCLAGLVPPPASAGMMDKKTSDFVAANMIAIYYHEFGHALIDILKLPIFGQEEDAADVLSAVLIHDFFDEKIAQRIAFATAFGQLGDKDLSGRGGDVAYWDVHGPDIQRYYTFVCLFYGGNPTARKGLADRLKLPEPRRRTCPEEFEQAKNAWGSVIEKLEDAGGGQTIRFLVDNRVNEAGKLTADVLSREVAAMNRDLSLPKRLLVRVEPCDVVNAFYDAKTREIIMCTEFPEWLIQFAPR